MFVPRSVRFLSAFLAVLLLSLSVISRAPQSGCRCLERKSARARQAEESKKCVFGQMRSLTANFVLPASVDTEVATKISQTPFEVSLRYEQEGLPGIPLRARARSPPRSPRSC